MGAANDVQFVQQHNLEQSCQIAQQSQNHQKIQQNIENQQPTVKLSNKFKKDFKKQFTASKNIMNDQIKRQFILKNNRQRRYQRLMEDSENSLKQNAMTQQNIQNTIFEAFNRIGVHIPTFQIIEIDHKQFTLVKTTPIIDDYQCIREIGRGSYGSVYRARDKRTNELRAIKIIDKQNMTHHEKQSLINQFQILRKLDHPKIIKLYDIYDEANFFYVVTQLCEGGNLLAFVTERKTVAQGDIKDIMTQLLSAVKYLHHCNILHRDIKLQNIVLIKKKNDETDERIEIKLIDFGISLDLEKNPKSQTQYALGTLLYMSPESLNNKITLSSDIWSCGIVLYILSTKKLPYIYKSETELRHKIENGYFTRKHLSPLTLDLKLFLARLLQENCAKRLTASVAMESAWLTKAPHRLNLTNSMRTKLAEQIFNYDAKNNLISLVQGYLVSKMITQEERQRLANLFAEFDEDKSGVIQIEEFEKFYYNNSLYYDSNEIQELARIIDKNKSGSIDFTEFITAMYSRRKLFELQSLEMAFDYCDRDKSGEISKNQFEKILKGVHNEQIQHLFNKLDKNRDKSISKGEFLNYFREQI